jgi:hypothetical protein
VTLRRTRKHARVARRALAAGLLVCAAPATIHAAAVCDPIGVVNAVVSITPPKDTHVVGVKLKIDYPHGLDLPGFADEPSVKQRVSVLPGGLLYSPNDTDESLIVALVGTTPIAAGPLLSVTLDRCKGAPAPTAKDFRCDVEQGSDDKGGLLAKGIGCTVALEAQKARGK